MHVDFALLATMFAVAAIAGAFDAIAGGGGLLTVPALLLTGMNPVAALGTNKLQGAFGALSSTSAFARRGLIDWKTALPVAGAAAVAGLCGALCASLLSPRVLAALVPLLLIVIALYFGLSKGLQAGQCGVEPGEPVAVHPEGRGRLARGAGDGRGGVPGRAGGVAAGDAVRGELIRPLLVVMSCAMAVKLLSDPANPLRHAVVGLFTH